MSNHKIIQSIKIVDANDVEKPVTWGSKIRLQAGLGFQITSNSESAEVVIAADVTAAASDPYYVAKFDALRNGGSGAGYAFNSVNIPWYIASINKVKPSSDGNFMLVGSACAQIGLFDDVTIENNIPVAASPETGMANNPGQLSILDICTADVDCEDYQRLYDYLSRIKLFMDKNKDRNLTEGVKLFKQYQATVTLWNYLANSKSLIFEVQGLEGAIAVEVGYFNTDCYPMGCTITNPPSGVCIKISYRITKESGTGPSSWVSNFVLWSHGELAEDFEYKHSDIPSGLEYTTRGKLQPKEWIAFASVCTADSETQSSESSPPGTPPFGYYKVVATWSGIHLGTISMTKYVQVSISNS